MSSSAASSCTSCPKGSTASATTACSPDHPVPTTSHAPASYSPCPRLSRQSQRAAKPLTSLPMLRRSHDHYRDFRARLHAASSANRSSHCHQDRYIMTTIAILQRCNDLGQRWLRTGGDHARTDASSHHRTQPATATLNDNPDQQIELLSSARRVNRLQRLCGPTPTLSAPLNSP